MPEVSAGRRRFLLGAGALAATGAAAWGTWTSRKDGDAVPDGRRGRPSFVLVVADDLGYGQIGAYGQRRVSTPRLDRLAAEGLRFTDAYAAAPVCAPARASLLTGLHGGHSPVRRNPLPSGDLPLDPAVPTIAATLRKAGYRTGLFGKWGFGPAQAGPAHPMEHGFGDFYGYLTHTAAKRYYPTQLWDGRRPVPLPGNTGRRGPHYGPDLIVERAVRFLRESRDQAFLLMLTLPLPHAPNSPPPAPNPYSAHLGWRRADRTHAAQITRLDAYVGRLVDELRAQGREDVIVMFTGDNGPHEESGVRPDFFDANGPYRGYKRNLYEGGIRVPFLVWSPTLPQALRGRSTAHPTVHYDLPATLADLAGAPAPPTDGLSLRPVLSGRGRPRRHEYLYWERLHAGATPGHRAADRGRGRRAAAAVRFDHWKVIGFAPGRDYTTPDRRWSYELYDLDADPGETRDLAGRHPDLIARAQRYMRRAWDPPAP